MPDPKYHTSGGDNLELKRVEQPPLFAQHAYEEVKNAIISHLIPQGSVIYERDLSTTLGVSRTPLQQAIKRLELEGWVKSIPRKGVLVSHISKEDVEEVLQLRKANEVLAIELLTPNLLDEEIEKLEEIFRKQTTEQKDNRAFITTDTDFHMFLVEISRNRRLTQLMKMLTDQMLWFGIFIQNNITSRSTTVLQEHKAILEGIRERDVKKAKTALIEHMDRTRSAFVTAIQSMEEKLK